MKKKEEEKTQNMTKLNSKFDQTKKNLKYHKLINSKSHKTKKNQNLTTKNIKCDNTQKLKR